jgi:putative methyltransferase
MEALRQQVEKDAAGEEAGYPRWVRVNAIKSSVEEQLGTTFARYERALSLQQVINGGNGGGGGGGGEGGSSTAAAKHVFIDPHVPNLLAVTQGTDLTKTEAYTAGKIILQDKASCFPAYLLSPGPEDGDVVDACAAPGNKTTHLAGILHSRQPDFKSEPQTIYAFEKDSRRAKTLEKMVQVAGSTKITKIAGGQDFLQVNPLQDKYKNVGALLLDPSCSGSGIVGRDSMPEVHLPEAPGGGANKKEGQEKNPKGQGRKRKHAEVEEKKQDVLVDDDGNEVVVKSEKDLQARLDALSSFQLILLLHAFRFPAARKITYSTCSVHAEENENVVMQALQSDVAKQRGWRIMRRDDQVTGMREWPVRGLPDACEGDTDIAEGCIRSYKDDGHGVMGFFVAGFVRDGEEQFTNEEDDDGPYMRDEDGVILRDVMGMPVLKATGLPVELVPRSDEEEEQEEEEEEEEEWAGLGD